ncbi:MAG: GatB/YqeY domain-containing protein [Bacilli bacterium]|jgi:hypothetical protein|nr:gatB/Yqey domain protein [Firmicutes bacterium CAG:345]
MLIDEIKKANMQALKDKDKATRAALSTVINKYMLLNVENKAKGKETTDADVISILQKSVKELEEEKNMFVKAARQDKIDEMNIQINAVKKYLPEMMSEDEIRKIISGLEDKSVKSVMAYFKENYAGKVEMAKVSQVLRSL